MKQFHVRISQNQDNTYKIEFYYGSDLRYDRNTIDIPIMKICLWMRRNDTGQ